MKVFNIDIGELLTTPAQSSTLPAMSKKINLNKLAESVAAREGGKSNLSIAQIKEVLSHALNLLAIEKPSAVLATLESRV